MTTNLNSMPLGGLLFHCYLSVFLGYLALGILLVAYALCFYRIIFSKQDSKEQTSKPKGSGTGSTSNSSDDSKNSWWKKAALYFSLIFLGLVAIVVGLVWLDIHFGQQDLVNYKAFEKDIDEFVTLLKGVDPAEKEKYGFSKTLIVNNHWAQQVATANKENNLEKMYEVLSQWADNSEAQQTWSSIRRHLIELRQNPPVPSE